MVRGEKNQQGQDLSMREGVESSPANYELAEGLLCYKLHNFFGGGEEEKKNAFLLRMRLLS